MQTAIEWLDEQLQDTMYFVYGYTDGVRKVTIPLEDYMRLKQVALEMEKEQIINAFDEGQEYEYQVFVNSAPRFFSDTYYNETYGSKGSDEEKTNSQRFDEFMQLVTSSQTEISDEEIEKAFTDASERLSEYKEGLIDGAKWYREQLKLK